MKTQIQIVKKNSIAYRILKYLNSNPNNSYPMNLTRNADTTSTGIVPNIESLLKLEFIEIKLQGKKKYYFITKKGREFLYKLMELERKLN